MLCYVVKQTAPSWAGYYWGIVIDDTIPDLMLFGLLDKVLPCLVQHGAMYGSGRV